MRTPSELLVDVTQPYIAKLDPVYELLNHLRGHAEGILHAHLYKRFEDMPVATNAISTLLLAVYEMFMQDTRAGYTVVYFKRHTNRGAVLILDSLTVGETDIEEEVRVHIVHHLHFGRTVCVS
jgi:hypothetical protein